MSRLKGCNIHGCLCYGLITIKEQSVFVFDNDGMILKPATKNHF